jgi:hypothetical protein
VRGGLADSVGTRPAVIGHSLRRRDPLLARRENGDMVHYVYADPIVCGCLYVGTQEAYNKFKANELAQHLVDQQQITAQTYSDASWNWNAWGPWGPYSFPYRPLGW